MRKMPLKLNLGCGFNKINGFVNVDYDASCNPDVNLAIDKQRWPWHDDSVSHVVMDHALEHCGETTAEYFHLLKELYRVCRNGAIVEINVPHPRHDNFLHDATHVRAITEQGLAMFDQVRNLNAIRQGDKESKLGIFIGVNFRLKKTDYVLDRPLQQAYNEGIITKDELMIRARYQNNIFYEIRMELEVVK